MTVNGTLVPDAIVTGRESPLNTKALLFEDAADTVTAAPLAVKLPDAVPLVPTTTFPTAIVVGETASCPTVATPVPDREMARVEFEAFDETLTLPLALPAAAGAKATLKVTLCPDESVTGTVIPEMLNPLPLALT